MKRWITLGAVVVVIASMVVAVVLLRDRPPQPVTTTPGTTAWTDDDRVQLLSADWDDVRSVTVVRPEGSFTIENRGEGFFWPVYPYDVEFSQDRIYRLVSNATYISSWRTIGEVDSLGDFGLADPETVVTLELTDGTRKSISIGGKNPARDAHYVLRDGDPNVYVVYEFWLTPFFTTIDGLREERLPGVDFARLDRVEVDTLAGRSVRVVRRDSDDPELALTSHVVTSPYRRTYHVNYNWFETLGEHAAQLVISRFVSDRPTNLAQYGLAPPRARFLFEDENSILELLVGDESGSGRYAKYSTRPEVFVLDGAEPIVSARPYGTISPWVLLISIDLVDRFEVRTAAATYTGRIERTIVEGEDDPIERFTLNGREIEDEFFRKRIYQPMIGLMLDAEGTFQAAAEPVASIVYHLNDGSEPREVRFVPESASFLGVVRDGVGEFVVARSKIDRLIASFEEALE